MRSSFYRCLENITASRPLETVRQSGFSRPSKDEFGFERDCANEGGPALFSDGRTRKPGFVDGAEAVISGSVSVSGPMRRLAHGSRFLTISRGRSNTWTTLNFRSCSRPLPSRSIGVGGAPRIKSPPLRRPGRHHAADLRRYVTERPERLMRFRKEEQTSSGRRSGRGSNLRPSPGRSEYPSPW
jgi:hypothetical protein